MKTYTHAELVARGGRWLRGAYRCRVVLEEFPSWSGEIPDVLGWRSNGRSIMIECKATRADFLSDHKKPWRANPLIAVGAERYYLAPPKTIAPNEIPEDWGLLETRGNGVTIVKHARPRKDLRSEVAKTHEMQMLIRALQRVQLRLSNTGTAGCAMLTEWVKIDNKSMTPEQMYTLTDIHPTEEERLASEGWVRAFEPSELPEDFGEPWCPIHDQFFSACTCLPRNLPNVDYAEFEGKWYGRRRDSNYVVPNATGTESVRPFYPYRMPEGVACPHPGCGSHYSHRCEGCGRIGMRSPLDNSHGILCPKHKDLSAECKCLFIRHSHEMYLTRQG